MNGLHFALFFCYMLFFSFQKAMSANWRWSKTQKLISSLQVNDFLKDSSSMMVDGMHKSHESTEQDQSDFVYECPGDSWLVGFSSPSAKKYPFERTFAFQCAFFEDQNGLILKKNLKEAKPFAPPPYDQQNNPKPAFAMKPQEDAVLSCPSSQFLFGIASVLYPYFAKDDRLFEPLCAGLAASESSLKLGTCQTSALFGGKSDSFQFTCPQDTILTKIQLVYNLAAQDRSFQFNCCPVL